MVAPWVQEFRQITQLTKRCGRRKTLDEHDRRRLVRIISSDSSTTLYQVTAQFYAAASTTVSVRTVKCCLHDTSFRIRRPARVPLMNASRLDSEHCHWTRDDWKLVARSDESLFQLFRTDGQLRVWRNLHGALDTACQQGTVQAGDGSVMVWSCSSGVPWDPWYVYKRLCTMYASFGMSSAIHVLSSCWRLWPLPVGQCPATQVYRSQIMIRRTLIWVWGPAMAT